MESDGDSLLSSNFFSSSSPLCRGKDVAQISVGLNICSASVEVQEECEIKLVSVACAAFYLQVSFEWHMHRDLQIWPY